ncbi:MAG: GNAT family N-acetyltransferase [Bacteroidales bacterium]|nr:GNAT family N-acetyltransferase [Bacteroidales bacterium]
MERNFNPQYYTIGCSSLSDKQAQDCSDLYSADYGTWSGLDEPKRKGKRIKLSPEKYMSLRKQKDMYVSLCYDGDKLIGHAFFLNKTLEDGKKCIWVTQLVVRSFYRNRGIAKKLLRSAWGMSDYFAWGLATTNAITIKTLESVTWRQVIPSVVGQHIEEIRSLCEEIDFANKERIIIDKEKSQIYTNFYPNFQKLNHQRGLDELYVGRLGKIEDGHEWLAFTFQEQERVFNEDQWNEMLDFSSEQLEDAYSRMDMQNQPWTRYTEEEIDFVIEHTNLSGGQKVLDLGCGQGRHSIALAKRKKYDVFGVDFSERLLNVARKNAEGCAVSFLKRDARNLSIEGSFDVIMCLYDVIGSFRTLEQNVSIIDSIHKKLKKHGRCVVSVMNMELTEYLATRTCNNVQEHTEELVSLPASEIMRSTGNIFNPNYFLLDKKSRLVYRKEQFHHDNYLSSEYVIADYRFTRKELIDAFEKRNFKVHLAEYVQTGKWSVPLTATDHRAKEILLVAEKIG